MTPSGRRLRTLGVLFVAAVLLALPLLSSSGQSGGGSEPARDLLALPSEQGDNDWRVSFMGPDGDLGYAGLSPAIAYGRLQDQYLAVWTGDDVVVDEHDVYGQRIDAENGAPLGAMFLVSDLSGGDNLYNAREAALAYDDSRDQFLVVWAGSSTTAGMGANELEIWGQRVSAADGALLGGTIRVSAMGADGDASRSAFHPDVAYNRVDGEFLVVWHGDDADDNVVEVYGQRINASTGALVGATGFAISQMGSNPADGAYRGQHAAVAYDRENSSYLVVWEGDHDAASLVDEAFEIFGQRLWPDGTLLGTPGFRISAMGADGDPDYDARRPDVAYHPQTQEYLVVWAGEDGGALADEEYEIYGQRLDAAGNAIGDDDFRISTMGEDGNAAYKAFHPRVAFVPNDAYLVVWRGDDGSPQGDDAFEIYAQFLEGDGAATGPDDWRISDMGGDDASADYGADQPALAVRGCRGNAMAVWQGNDLCCTLAQDEIEVFAQGLGTGYAEAVVPDVSAVGGPERFCPGWNLYYEVDVDNTTACWLTDVQISVTLPPDSCCLQDGAGSDVPGVLQPGDSEMVWTISALAPGEVGHIEVSLHPHSSLPDGRVVTTTFAIDAEQLLVPEQRDVSSTADRSLCAKPTVTPVPMPETPTVTVEPEASPTPTPDGWPGPTSTVTPTIDPDATPTTTQTLDPDATPTMTIETVGRFCLPLVIR